ncbi:hypothetical protein OS493_005270 [Desmophyllum pertusum]|uniref:Uncharacterized protein n=1 Tax=Desmophyllum pertusum TaxID=174260 RepID=A0A9W9Z4F7_9CNID|nr:hypothetical protein OS493_005270 [Desmophyllum pertusum]
MFRLKIALAFLVLIIAQDTLSKSIKKKKHSKKQSIPKQKAHYLLLMGSPVEDEHNHKGLGMILSSKLREEPDKLKDGPSKEADHHHHHNKPDTDLAATLQTSSKGYPSDRGFSYTEALFTGAPLLNGRPFMASDRNQGHENGHSIGPTVNGHEKAADGYKGASFAELQVDKSNEHNKEEGSVQIQKEVHTEEGVSGLPSSRSQRKVSTLKNVPQARRGKMIMIHINI